MNAAVVKEKQAKDVTEDVVLDIRNVCKQFPGVQALADVSLHVKRHEIVGLVGENGAGKSTLLKILIGAYQPDEGEIRVRGRPVHVHSVKEATDVGLAMVFQEQSMLSNLTVRENIYLGHEESFSRSGVLNWKKMDQEARRQLDKVDFDPPPLGVRPEVPAGAAHPDAVLASRAEANFPFDPWALASLYS